MFSGLIQDLALVHRVSSRSEGGVSLVILSESPEVAGASEIGASIAINGACMTVVKKETTGSASLLYFDVSEESLRRTQFRDLGVGSKVHLEASMKLGDFVGGHLVSGHVDCVGQIYSFDKTGDFVNLVIRIDAPSRNLVAPYLVEKGCLAVDGVSLTVNQVKDTATYTDVFITLIPHTLEMTRFKGLPKGALVNLEADLVAKYVDRAGTFRQKYPS